MLLYGLIFAVGFGVIYVIAQLSALGAALHLEAKDLNKKMKHLQDTVDAIRESIQ